MRAFAKIVILLLFLALMAGGLIACAKEDGSKGLEYHQLSDGSYAVSAGETTQLERIEIPARHKGRPVTLIHQSAFKNAKN